MAVANVIRELVAELAYPPGDVRVAFGELAIEIGEALDAEGGGRLVLLSTRRRETTRDTAGWWLSYVLQDLTDSPNDPPTMLNEIRYRYAQRRWAYLRRGPT